MMQQSSDKILDDIFDKIDDLCWKGSWKEINDILSGLDVNNTHIDVLLAYATTTSCVRHHLPFRIDFIEKVRKVIVAKKNRSKTFIAS